MSYEDGLPKVDKDHQLITSVRHYNGFYPLIGKAPRDGALDIPIQYSGGGASLARIVKSWIPKNDTSLGMTCHHSRGFVDLKGEKSISVLYISILFKCFNSPKFRGNIYRKLQGFVCKYTLEIIIL